MRLSPAVETGSMHCLDSFTAHFMLSGGGAGRGGGGLGKKMRKKMAEFDIKGIFIFLELFLMNFSICLCAVQKH